MIKLSELEVYKVALEIGEIVWAMVEKWVFLKKTLWGNNLQEQTL